MKTRELTQDTDNPLWWILRGAYSTGKSDEARADKDIEEKKRELVRLMDQKERAQEKRDAAESHAADLGWTLTMSYEK